MDHHQTPCPGPPWEHQTDHPGTESGTDYPIGTGVRTDCAICDGPRRVEADAALDDRVPMSAIAERLGIPKTSVWRHSQHRADRDRVESALLRLSMPEPEPTAPVSHSVSALGKFSDRLRQIAVDTATVGQVATQVRDPRLLLAALKAEHEQLIRLAQLAPETAETAYAEGRDAALAVVGDAIAMTVHEGPTGDALVSRINAMLIERGIEHPEQVPA